MIAASRPWWFDTHGPTISAAVAAILVGVTIAYVVITHRLLEAQRLDRTDRLERERSEQARLIGGHLGHGPVYDNQRKVVRLRGTFRNASPLPVRDVVGYVFLRDTGGFFDAFPSVATMEPGAPVTVEMDLPAALAANTRLEFYFDDDNGQRWHKYGTTPLVAVDRGDGHLEPKGH
jgi:hypothetical protein